MQETAPSARARSRRLRRVLAVSVVALGGLLLLAGAVTLVMPNSVHVDIENVGKDIFFDCGGALYPSARPAEEPGISECADYNEAMLRAGIYLVAAGTVALLLGLALLHRRRTQP